LGISYFTKHLNKNKIPLDEKKKADKKPNENKPIRG